MEIPIELISDGKGYIDRQCPRTECSYVFKVHMEDWSDRVSNEIRYCPMCGYTAHEEQWFTDEQIEQVQQIAARWALNYASKEISKMFKRLESEARGNNYMQIRYKPGKPITFINTPIGQREEWALSITCEGCGTRYGVIGSAYFCPCCGANPIERIFSDSLDTVSKQIESLGEIRATFEGLYGRDQAETLCRSMLEGALADIVSAFQKLAHTRFVAISSKKVQVNDFQRVDAGSLLFQEADGRGYEAWLTPEELNTMKVQFQRRHVLEHNYGFVDSRYLDRSGDKSYIVGQRLVVKESDVLELLRLVAKLGEGLRSIETGLRETH